MRNGAAPRRMCLLHLPVPPPVSPLETAIWQTVHYFDAFALPVTPVQIWRGLIREGTGLSTTPVRLAAITAALQTSPFLQARLACAFGFWAPIASAGHSSERVRQYVRARLRRQVLAQQKWRQLRRMSIWLAAAPFVRMVGGSGSLALQATTWVSDLDVFIVARAGRIWTARLLLLLIVQGLGRRRKYGDRHAPDKICLNHYVADNHLAMAPDNRSVYTAVLFRRLVPVWGQEAGRRWLAANAVWIARFLTDDPVAAVLRQAPICQSGGQAVRLPHWLRVLKYELEAWLLEAPGTRLERWAERVQRRAVSRHTRAGRGGRVVLSDAELAFHPDSRADSVLREFRGIAPRAARPAGATVAPASALRTAR